MAPSRFAIVAVVVAALPLGAADPPKKSLLSAGTVEAKLGELGDKIVTVKQSELEPVKSRSRSRLPAMQAVEKEHEYDLAPDVLFRRQDLPRGTDGKAKSFTNEEYARLREPLSAPGYRAERKDFKPGQIVRLYFGKETSRDRPVVTTVLLLKDTPEPAKKPDEKKK